MKTCTKCHVEKELTEFKKVPRGKYGVHSVCKPCVYQEKRELREGYVKPTKDEYGFIAPPPKRPFTLKIGDKVKFLKTWDSNNKGKSYGYGIVSEINEKHFTVKTPNYKETFLKLDCGHTVAKVRE